MNHCLKLASQATPTPVGEIYSGLITGFDDESCCWVIDGSFKAMCAASLLVQPCAGDKICFIQIAEEYFIIQLLSRPDCLDSLVLSSDKKVRWQAPELKFTAFENLELTSLNKIALNSKHCAISIANTLIQQAENLLQQVGQCTLSAKGLLRLKGRQQVITAEKDVRIDGERINMG